MIKYNKAPMGLAIQGKGLSVPNKKRSMGCFLKTLLVNEYL
jgi:hypothetical protein